MYAYSILLTLLPYLVHGELIDLTNPFNNKTIYWPTSKAFQHTNPQKGPSGVIPWYESNDYSANEHGGTHIDAPVHFALSQDAAKKQWTVDQIPISHLVAPAVKIDITQKTIGNHDYELTVRDIEDWEMLYGRIPEKNILFIYTGWSKLWNNETFLGTGSRNTTLLHFPGISPSAALAIADRKVFGVGVDVASLDYGQSNNFSTHQILFAKNIYGLENVNNLERIPTKGAVVHALPMLIAGGSGAPCRIIAEWDGGVNTGIRIQSNSWFMLFFMYVGAVYGNMF